MSKTDSALWLRITDRDGAAYIVRAAGMSVIFAGIMLAGTGVLSTIFGIISNLNLAIFTASFVFIIFGMRIKNLKSGSLPYFSVLSLINLLALTIIEFPSDKTISVVLNLTILNGLRGWWWLRRDPFLECPSECSASLGPETLA